MENIYTEVDKKRIQEEILNIFLEVKKIIEKHNLRYFAIGGTCLGAVRHQGFIPWDDDLDIAMPENDYEEFLRMAKRELPPYLKVLNPGNAKYSALTFSKVYNENTAYIETSDRNYPNLYKGVFIDIMPLCGVPSDPKRYLKKSKLYTQLNSLTRRPPAATQKMYKKALKRLLWWSGHLLGNNFFFRKWYGYVTKFKFDESEFTGYIWANEIFTEPERMIFPQKWFEKYVELPFENTTIRCPQEWDRFLTSFFGDYMKLPDEENRISNHYVEIIDLERPCSYYKNLAEKGEMQL